MVFSPLIEMDHFPNSKQQYALNIWLTLYYRCGINPVDLLSLKWGNVELNHIQFLFLSKIWSRSYLTFTINISYYV